MTETDARDIDGTTAEYARIPHEDTRENVDKGTETSGSESEPKRDKRRESKGKSNKNKGRKADLTTVERDKEPGSGTLARALQQLEDAILNPDAKMIGDAPANNIEALRGMNVEPSKLFADGGQKLAVTRFLAQRAALVSMPESRAEVFDALEGFFTFCGRYQVPVTVGGFAVWCGVSLSRVNQIERDKSDERSEAISLAKDTIRHFLEIAAMDSSINPIIYFHQNKVYYGAVENQQVTVRVDDNAREIDDAEMQRRRSLLMEQGPDGVFRATE